MTTATIEENVRSVRADIERACHDCGRDPSSVHLIGAAKTKSVAAVRAAFHAGVTAIGENYLQEAVEKITELDDLAIEWHYIGAIQSNKTRLIATHFDWVQTVDRSKIAERLSGQCPPAKTLNVLIQVNIDRDPAKAGVMPEDAGTLKTVVDDCPNLRARGLMTILSTTSDPHTSYQSMAQLFAELAGGADWDALSMGMTKDVREAILAGATHVRVGTALFGSRRQ